MFDGPARLGRRLKVWVLDSCLHILRGAGDALVTLPSLLLLFAWWTWRRAPAKQATGRTKLLLLALVSESVAVGGYLFQIAYWRLLPSFSEPNVLYCGAMPYSDLAIFLATVAAALLSIGGRGPAQLPVWLTAGSLLLVRATVWSS